MGADHREDQSWGLWGINPISWALCGVASIVLPAALFMAPDFARSLDELGSAAWITQLALVPLLFRHRKAWAPIILGGVLAVLAAHNAAELGNRHAHHFEPRVAPSHDLRDGPIPQTVLNAREGWVNLRGYLFLDQHIDEYQVAPGQRPDQAKRAPRMLTPLTGFDPAATQPSASDPADPLQAKLEAQVEALTSAPQLKLRPDERLLIAKVHAEPPPTPQLRTHFGHIEPVAPELVTALVDLPEGEAAATLIAQARLLDTTKTPPNAPTQGELIQLVLAALASLSLLCLGSRRKLARA